MVEPYVFVPENKEKICRPSLDRNGEKIKGENEMVWNPDFLRTFHIMEQECIPLKRVVKRNENGEEEIVYMEKEERQQFKDRVFANAGSPGNVTRYLLKHTFQNYAKRKSSRSSQTISPPEEIAEEEWLEWLKQENGQSADPEDTFDSALENLDKEILDQTEKKIYEFWNRLPEKDRAAIYVFVRSIPTTCMELQEKTGLTDKALSRKRIVMFERIKQHFDQKGICEEDQKIIFRKVSASLYFCCQNWEGTSELGKWIHSHFRDDGKKKMRFIPGGAAITRNEFNKRNGKEC